MLVQHTEPTGTTTEGSILAAEATGTAAEGTVLDAEATGTAAEGTIPTTEDIVPPAAATHRARRRLALTRR
jgi:hypothetical protein